jgi:hypothetical protein
MCHNKSMVLDFNKTKVYNQISTLKDRKAVNIITFCAIFLHH